VFICGEGLGKAPASPLTPQPFPGTVPAKLFMIWILGKSAYFVKRYTIEFQLQSVTKIVKLVDW